MGIYNKMAMSGNCLIRAKDGGTFLEDRRILSEMSTYFRDKLMHMGHLEEPVIQLASLDSSIVEIMLKIMNGDAAVDIRAPENRQLREAAEFLGIIPQSSFDLQDLQVGFLANQVKTM